MLIYLEMIETENDKEKFEQLYYKYRNLMYYVAHEVTKNQHDAEDAVQQAFLSIIENLEKVDSVSSSRTRSFVSIIAEHKAVDIVRKRRPVLELVKAENELATYLPDDGDELLQAMAKLPKRYQNILLLHYHNGYSAHELSKMLGMSLSAVRKTIWRAKEALRKMLPEEVTGA